MLLRFTKMHGFGNDLMVIDLISQYAYIQPHHMRAWSDRRTGVGFQRLALIEVPQHPDVDFSCRMFDSDGAEVDWQASDLCCVARLVADKRLISKAQMRIELRHTVLEVEVHTDGSVSVPLAQPSVLADSIELPEHLLAPSPWLRATSFSMMALQGVHAVLPVLDVKQVPLLELAHYLEQHTSVARDTLITALQLQDRNHLKVATWQLGSGMVDNFHQGLCTAAVYAIERGWVNQRVHIESLCGTTRGWMHVPEREQRMYFTGLATRIYEGQIRL